MKINPKNFKWNLHFKDLPKGVSEPDTVIVSRQIEPPLHKQDLGEVQVTFEHPEGEIETTIAEWLREWHEVNSKGTPLIFEEHITWDLLDITTYPSTYELLNCKQLDIIYKGHKYVNCTFDEEIRKKLADGIFWDMMSSGQDRPCLEIDYDSFE